MNCGVPKSTSTRSKPGGVSERAISMTTGSCLGANRIFATCLALPGVRRLRKLLLRQRNGRGQARLAAEHARGMALAGRVLHQPRVTGPEDLLAAVAAADLELTGEDDDELPPRRRVPVEEPVLGPDTERDLRRLQSLEPVSLLLDVDRLDVRLAIGARVQPPGLLHRERPPSSKP